MTLEEEVASADSRASRFSPLEILPFVGPTISVLRECEKKPNLFSLFSKNKTSKRLLTAYYVLQGIAALYVLVKYGPDNVQYTLF